MALRIYPALMDAVTPKAFVGPYAVERRLGWKAVDIFRQRGPSTAVFDLTGVEELLYRLPRAEITDDPPKLPAQFNFFEISTDEGPMAFSIGNITLPTDVSARWELTGYGIPNGRVGALAIAVALFNPGKPPDFMLPVPGAPDEVALGVTMRLAMDAATLLTCRNIVTEDKRTPDLEIVDRNRPKRYQRRTIPGYVYKVLKITVPSDLYDTTDTTESERDAEGKVRHHFVRGHFKRLKHPRYKEPGLYWWPDHWRGNEKLGKVLKTYEAHPNDKV